MFDYFQFNYLSVTFIFYFIDFYDIISLGFKNKKMFKNKTEIKKIFHILLLTLIIFSPLFLSGCLKKQNPIKYRMSLEIWGVFDESDIIERIIQQYRKDNPQIKEVRYKRISLNPIDYEKELLDALASGKGPDIFYFHNTWLPKHQDKIAPFPDSSNYIQHFKETFVDVAFSDFVQDNQIYAFPLYCDTLGLYYNKDLLSQAGISTPPKTWDELMNQVKLLTKFDDFGNIKQATIAMGRSKDPGGINRAGDILALLILQSGNPIVDQKNKPVFDRSNFERVRPGQNALEFYTSFSQGNSDLYTWNSKMDYSIDSFRYGRTAMMINYSYWINRLKKLDPKLDFEVSTVPQIDLDNKVNFANYWGLAVTKNKILVDERNQKVTYTNNDRINEAWKLVLYLTDKPFGSSSFDFDPNAEYLSATSKPAARKDLIEKQKNIPSLGIFAVQNLTAKSFRQPDNFAVDEIFETMINNVASGKMTSKNAAEVAIDQFQALLKK